jgi:outer membrane receptor protein involved in Fe transport
MERMAFADKRAFVVAGTRFTSIDSVTQTGTAASARTKDETWSSSVGGVIKAYRGEKGQVALFYNANETFVPVVSIDQRLATFGEKFPNRTVSIREQGVKVDLLDSRLVATASWYKTDETNILISNVDVDGSVTGVTGRSYQSPAGRGKTVGWDMDVSYMRDFRMGTGPPGCRATPPHCSAATRCRRGC